jgi:hypothetical protein
MKTRNAAKNVDNQRLTEVIEAINAANPDQMERLWSLFTNSELREWQLPSSQTLQETEKEAG